MPSSIHRTITPVAKFIRRYHWFVAGSLIALMFGLAISTMSSESAIVDEVAHIPAAYSYDHFGDYRLNPEHPPLIKNLAGLPLQFMHLKFPSDQPAWTTLSNGEWTTGNTFLYGSGNNPSAILFWARLPILLLATAFAFVLYWYSRRHWGTATALLALFFYTLSPNIIAHSRYVTTDVGSSVFCFIALIVFVRFIREAKGRNLLYLSVALAVANLAKFNGVLLYPFLLGMAVVAAGLGWRDGFKRRAKLYVGGVVVASLISLVWIYLYYIPNTINMPTVVQIRLIHGSLTYGFGLQAASVLVWLAHVPLLKPLTQYLLGVTMVFGRVAGGNVTYLNGTIHNGSYVQYFPELFAVKTQVAFLILMVVTSVAGLMTWARPRRSVKLLWGRLAASVRQHLTEWTLGLFAAYYFAAAMSGNLNLGIRHILPIYIPLFVVVAVTTVKLTRRLSATKWRVASAGLLTILVGWYGLSTVLAYPSYTSYFNELIGGNANAENYFSDSPVDWGQDLVHLKSYVSSHHINKFAVDYFGGGSIDYYFCNHTYDASGKVMLGTGSYDCSHSPAVPWHSSDGHYTGQYIAVSETYLENDRYYAAQVHESGYAWLRAMTPVAKIGGSIYLYKLY